jgi:hypothetical protein
MVRPWEDRLRASAGHEPPVHPVKQKAEDDDENEDEDDGCRRDCTPAANDLVLSAEGKSKRRRRDMLPRAKAWHHKPSIPLKSYFCFFLSQL